MFKNNNKFIQFELWKDCSIGCKFCCNKGQPKTNKIKSMEYILSILNSDEIKEYNEIGLIGGEFFNNELKETNVREMFYKIIDNISKLNISKLYIATSLMYNIDNYLIPFLDYLEQVNLLDKLCLCTSYDLAYRFKSKEQETSWKMNMLDINNKYPNVHLHTEIILTQHFINAVNNKLFDIEKFSQIYNTRIDYIEPSSGLYYIDKNDCEKDIPGFFPTKKSFIQFLSNVRDVIDKETFLSMELRSNTLYFLEDNEYIKASERRDGDGRCQRKNNTKKYEIGFIDSNDSMANIAKTYFEMLGD